MDYFHSLLIYYELFRSVLLRKREPSKTPASAKNTADGNSSTTASACTGDAVKVPPPTPTRMANSSTVGNDGTERGDLIMFYNTGKYFMVRQPKLSYGSFIFSFHFSTKNNTLWSIFSVYMEKVQEFALKFRKQASLPPLSPLPMLRAFPASPCRKVSENHSLYVRALKPETLATAGGPGIGVGGTATVIGGGIIGASNGRFTSPLKPVSLSYNFSSSPAKVPI